VLAKVVSTGDLKAFGGWEGLLGYRLYQHLKKEDKVSGKARSEAEFNTLSEEAYASIDQHSAGRQRYHDVYATQVIQTRGKKERTWDGSYYNPECASIEALDPFAEGPDSLSGYHTVGNIAVTTSVAHSRVCLVATLRPRETYTVSYLSGDSLETALIGYSC